MITCLSCGEVKETHGKGLCKSCYNKQFRKDNPNYDNDWNHKTGKCLPMNKNKLCPQYLGIIVAEKVLSKVFKNVEVMPMHNPGYDFICGKGYKVDSKASCTYKNKNRSNLWSFTINKNKVADYFACLAFDNRNDINPLHFWLIPGSLVNDKKNITISESTISKWDEYKLDINKVIKCCNNLKGE